MYSRAKKEQERMGAINALRAPLGLTAASVYARQAERIETLLPTATSADNAMGPLARSLVRVLLERLCIEPGIGTTFPVSCASPDGSLVQLRTILLTRSLREDSPVAAPLVTQLVLKNLEALRATWLIVTAGQRSPEFPLRPELFGWKRSKSCPKARCVRSTVQPGLRVRGPRTT